MHILLIEASLSGHHSIYLERVALAYVKANHSVTIALPEGTTNIDDLRSNLSRYKAVSWLKYLPTFTINGTSTIELVIREYQIRKTFGRVYRDAHKIKPVDYVFIPYFDYCLYAMGLLGTSFGKSRFGGICMRPAFHYHECEVRAPRSKLDYVKHKLFRRLLNIPTLIELFTIDELLLSSTRRNLTLQSYKLKFIADPVAEPVTHNFAHVRESFKTPLKGKVILLYGAIDERKGIYQLLDALETRRDLDDWHVWLIGKQDATVRASLNGLRWPQLKNKKKIYSIDQYVDLTTEQMAFSACNVVWLGYKNHYGMSGVLVHAGMHSRPVLACSAGLIGWYVESIKMGITINESIESVISGFELLSDESYAKSLGENGHRIFKKNTWLNFEKSLIQI